MAPPTPEFRAQANPAATRRFAEQWARLEALIRNRLFIDDYADARARWRDGVAAALPAGTYWLQRFASVPIVQT